jgi:hypothetical protein
MAKDHSGDWFGYLLLGLGTGLVGYAVAKAESDVETPARTPHELLARLRKKVTDHHAHPAIRNLAHRLRQQAGPTALDRIVRIDKAVREKVGNQPDPGGRHDYYASPLETIQSLVGDCDDQAIMVATLLEADGFETAFLWVPKHVVACVEISVETLRGYATRFGALPFVIRDQPLGRMWLPLEVVRRELRPGQVMAHVSDSVRSSRHLFEGRPFIRPLAENIRVSSGRRA